MGCCQSNDAVVNQPDEEPAIVPASPEASPAKPSKPKQAPKESGGGLFGWVRKIGPKPAEDAQEESSPNDEPKGPKREIIPATGPQAPPPGWGGTPEVEQEEDDEDDAGRPSGPRAIENVPGGNGYISGTRKNQEISVNVMDRIKGLEKAGLRTKKRMGRKMLTPRIITDVKETWDKEGNVTRYMTHFIEEPDGRKHTKKETMYIKAGEPDPMGPMQ